MTWSTESIEKKPEPSGPDSNLRMPTEFHLLTDLLRKESTLKYGYTSTSATPGPSDSMTYMDRSEEGQAEWEQQETEGH